MSMHFRASEPRVARPGRRTLRWPGAVVAAVLVVAALAGCSSGNKAVGASGSGSGSASGATGGVGSTVGVTDTTITLSAVGTFSGPQGAFYENLHKTGVLLWADGVNKAGGINGRKIVIDKIDDGGTVEGAVAACKQIESNGSFAAATASAINEELSCLDQAGIPAWQIQVAAPNPQTVFKNVRSVTSAAAQAAATAEFVAGSQGLNRAGHKIGVLVVSDLPSLTIEGDEFVTAGKAKGLDIQVQKITNDQASFTGQLQQFKDKGVDTVVMICVAPAFGILRDAAAINYKPVWTGISMTADELAAAGAGPFSGIKAVRYWASADSPAFHSYKDKLAQFDPTAKASTLNSLGYGYMLVMQKALELAGRNLTRQSFLAAFDQIQNFDIGLLPPFSYGPGRTIGTDAAFPLECCNPDKTWKTIGPAASKF